MSDLGEIRTVFFDLDGVLVDSSIAIPRSINFALERQGLAPRPEESLRSSIGPPLLQAFREILESEALDPGLAEACVESYRERYRETCLDETTLMPGIEEAVQRLKEHRLLAVVTSKPDAFARPILEKLGIADCFALIVGPPLDSGRQESKTQTLERAMEALGLEIPSSGSPSPGAMVGDRHFDVLAGSAMRLVTVGVSWGIGSVPELRHAGADYIVHSPPELTRLFGL